MICWKAVMAKVNIEAAHWLIFVHPEDRPLQAVQWKEDIPFDGALPFGLPKIHCI